MAPSTRETIENRSSAAASAVQQTSTPAKPTSGSLRSDAVSLEIPIKIHGSRVTAVIRGVTPQTEPFEEQTATMIVFPQGGVLRMITAVNVGQMLVLTNLKSRQDAICRVVKVRSFPNMQSYVEVEFTQPQPKYWGVYFPSEGGATKRDLSPRPSPPDAAKQVSPEGLNASVPAQKTPAPKPRETPSLATEVSASRSVAAPAPAPKPASPFVSIGTQEKIQPAAAGMSEVSSPPTSEKQTYAPHRPTDDVAGLPVASPTDAGSSPLRDASEVVERFALSGTDEPPPKHATLGVEAIANTDAIFASLESEALPSDNAARKLGSFGARLDAAVSRSSTSLAAPGQNWMLIAACIAVLFGAVVAGVWYFRSRSGASGTGAVSPAISSALQSTESPTAETPASSVPLPSAVEPSSPPPSVPSDLSRKPHATAAAETSPAAGPHTAQGEDSGPSERKSATADSPSLPEADKGVFASDMKAHPLSSARSLDPRNQAPALDVANSVNEPAHLPAIVSPNVALPPPPAATPGVPVSSGARPKEPQLIFSVLPLYPEVAKQARVQGDVIINAYINKNGNVARMDVISGPSMLRQAALDALRKWKYRPSQLNGQPIEGDLLVKIKFRL
jgi:TonB family protein